ncbi:MAG: TonB-dependent receptor [Flavobacteriaceae bacterium]|nr:TonB-dependent receptor [Flavobacteriaceae bacterium]
MRLKDCSVLIIFFMATLFSVAQNKVSGVITANSGAPLADVEVYNKTKGYLASTNSDGYYEFITKETSMTIVFYAESFQVNEQTITISGTTTINGSLENLSEEMDEVVVRARKAQVFALKRLKDIEGTAIYAGKKTEVVQLDQSMANLASNNARQIYNQVSGLNIYQNDDAGLQLNIGGRGLDPNRTSNFNTRQNGYDISADVLGYPESYYSPPAEALEEIQVIRGAASLQYGTQFGGLINFVLKKPNPEKPFEIITRNTLGSFNLFTNFTSISGTKNKFSYYSYFNYKRGDGFRPNSQFESKNVFGHLGYQFNENTKVSGEVSYLRYLAQQAGGLTDAMFDDDPLQSNRARNWFEVDWLLYNLRLDHAFSERTNASINFFGLNASRSAIGFRNRRVDLADPGGARELLVSDFNNFGFETRLLSQYNLGDKSATYLLGAKFYKADNSDFQGPGSNGSNPDFSSAADQFPNYSTFGNFDNPNLNVALFGEHVIYLWDKFSITAGARFEYIKTESLCESRRTNFDGAGKPIGNETNVIDDSKERTFVLLGLGASYKINNSIEFYGNLSQNYRSITFSDVNIVNPSNGVDPNLDDEKGFTLDLGVRGRWKNWLSYDVSAFSLFYNNRIGFLFTEIPPVNNLGQLRTNIGDARILGVESLLDFNIGKILNLNKEFQLNYFLNTSFITSEYTDAIVNGTVGNSVEFIPDVNLKTGIRFGYKNLSSSVQYTYLSDQFTDSTNSVDPDVGSIIGIIPAYDILDISIAYTYKRFRLEAGVNNALDNSYFTRRATGYPGPGIIPSSPRNWYATLQIKL